MLSRNGSMQNFVIARAGHVFMAKTWGSAQSIGRYFSLKKENERLAGENFRLAKELSKRHMVEDALKSDSMAHALSAADTGGYSYMPASIVKISRNKQHNYIIIDKGSEDGVKPHSGLITSHGIIGIIDAVGRHYSYVMSFMNTEMNISARLGREGAVGPLEWDGKTTYGAVLKEIPLQYKFNPGDTVYSSGYSSMFPPGIPLGLTGKAKIINGATYDISIILLQDFRAIKYVTIVTNEGAGEMEELEKQAEEAASKGKGEKK